MRIKLPILLLLLLVGVIYSYFASYTSTFIGINELRKDGNIMTNDLGTTVSGLNRTSLQPYESSFIDITKSFEKSSESAKVFTISVFNFGFNHIIGLVLAPIIIFIIGILLKCLR